MTTGRITLPVPQAHRDYLLQVRRGELPLVEVIGAVNAAEQTLLDLRQSAPGARSTRSGVG